MQEAKKIHSIKFKKPHENRSLIQSSISKIEVDKNVFGLSSFKDIDLTFKQFCQNNAEKNGVTRDKNLF